ncbi:hypothetical protein SUGI_0547160 [Cryptomeria japonica]|nr:hypothetical protein SUGI_0547160 [Cryptomeria japonica]
MAYTEKGVYLFLLLLLLTPPFDLPLGLMVMSVIQPITGTPGTVHRRAVDFRGHACRGGRVSATLYA